MHGFSLGLQFGDDIFQYIFACHVQVLPGEGAHPLHIGVVPVRREQVPHKNGFLQQNSFDEVDMYCVPAKQVRLLELIMEFHERSRTCISLGAPLIKITSLDIKERLSRLKSVIKNDEIAEFTEFEQEMRADLEDLERGYRAREVL